MEKDIPIGWQNVIGDEFEKPYFKELEAFVDAERKEYTVFPPEEDVFNAFRLTPFDRMKVLLLGQDPYHGPGQAHGLCFSVQPGVKPPPSLINMFKELRDGVGAELPNNGCLIPWAEQGVLLLNAVLTVRAHKAGSHARKGWEQFTDAVISAANAREEPVVFVLWGGYAKQKGKHIDASRHPVIESGHPSPLSVNHFRGTRPFSRVNAALEKLGKSPIDWRIPNI